jgi:hypothetical protein
MSYVDTETGKFPIHKADLLELVGVTDEADIPSRYQLVRFVEADLPTEYHYASEVRAEQVDGEWVTAWTLVEMTDEEKTKVDQEMAFYRGEITNNEEN